MRPQRYQPGRRRPIHGFTLVEIMIVVTIIGLLVAMGVPAWAKARRNTQNSAFISDLRSGLYAAQTCALETGSWPAESPTGIIPPAMVPYSKSVYWTTPSPIGGNWDWDFNQGSIVAGLKIVGVTADTAQMQEIDAKIDDGNLSTGKFQGSGTTYVYILE